jgi:hypothetical protein
MLNPTIESSQVLEDLQVLLDGSPVEIPAGRCSLGAIRSHLETLALEKHRVLWSFNVAGAATRTADSSHHREPSCRVEGQTFELDDVPIRIVRIALEQTADAREELDSVIAISLADQDGVACELWWKLARQLKQPLLTLSLLPEDLFGTSNGTVSILQLRRWQLEQLGAILREVNEACWSRDQNKLPNALQNLALGWLNSLQGSLELWQETLIARRG